MIALTYTFYLLIRQMLMSWLCASTDLVLVIWQWNNKKRLCPNLDWNWEQTVPCQIVHNWWRRDYKAKNANTNNGTEIYSETTWTLGSIWVHNLYFQGSTSVWGYKDPFIKTRGRHILRTLYRDILLLPRKDILFLINTINFISLFALDG